jgi:hypothetical protein
MWQKIMFPMLSPKIFTFPHYFCVRANAATRIYLMLLRVSSAPRESASQDLLPIWFLIIFENKRRHIAGLNS